MITVWKMVCDPRLSYKSRHVLSGDMSGAPGANEQAWVILTATDWSWALQAWGYHYQPYESSGQFQPEASSICKAKPFWLTLMSRESAADILFLCSQLPLLLLGLLGSSWAPARVAPSSVNQCFSPRVIPRSIGKTEATSSNTQGYLPGPTQTAGGQRIYQSFSITHKFTHGRIV